MPRGNGRRGGCGSLVMARIERSRGDRARGKNAMGLSGAGLLLRPWREAALAQGTQHREAAATPLTSEERSP